MLALLLCAARTPQKARTFSAAQIDGGTFDLAPHLGRDVVVIAFFATDCSPCMAELPALQTLWENHKKEGLVVVGVSIDEPRAAAAVRPFVRERGVGFPVVIDTKSDAVSLYDPKKFVPHTVLIDRSGMIAWQHTGFDPGDDTLATTVERLLSPR